MLLLYLLAEHDLAFLTAKLAENTQRKLYLTYTSFAIPLGSKEHRGDKCHEVKSETNRGLSIILS